jgi:NAD(P)-dependent dehydrogenase (short-subunit alcohol dehydrogenase family)
MQLSAAPALDGRDRLIISIWPIAALGDWEASRAASAMTAFTRHAALAWAPARIRVNAVTIATRDRGVGQEGGGADVAALVSAMWRWRSMTGQIIGLTS